jgi:hypothetical protein
VFHVSQLKVFIPNHSPVYSQLSTIPALHVLEVTLEKIIDQRLVKKGNVVVTRILVQWSNLPKSSTTWEDYYVLKMMFPSVTVWG